MTGIEGGVVFEDGDGSFDRIEGRSSAREDGIAGFQRVADTGLVGGSGVSGDGPCAPVDEQSRSVVGGRGHRNIVEHLAQGCENAPYWELICFRSDTLSTKRGWRFSIKLLNQLENRVVIYVAGNFLEIR